MLERPLFEDQSGLSSCRGLLPALHAQRQTMPDCEGGEMGLQADLAERGRLGLCPSTSCG